MLSTDDLRIPPYRRRTLADLSRPLFSALGVAGFDNPLGIVRRSANSRQADSVGHHGSVTPAEQLVPYILVRA